MTAAAADDAAPGKIPKQRPADGPRFDHLQPPLRVESLAVLKAQGFERATPVQAATIGLLAGNKDVAVEACTGSGKTLAFVLPLVEILARAETPFRKHSVGAIVVSPTRELAKQIYDVLVPFLSAMNQTPEMLAKAKAAKAARAMLLVGGTDAAADAKTFAEKGAVALVGTPGRLDDVMVRSKVMDLKRVDLLILDEADRLLSMGFMKTLNAIVARLPKQRRTGLFSATQTEETEELARAGLRNPVRVTVRDAASQAAAKAAVAAGAPATSAAARGKLPAQLRLTYKICPVDRRLWHLREFLRGGDARGKKVIAYFLTCACVDYFATALEPGGPADPNATDGRRLGSDAIRRENLTGSSSCEVIALHGKMKQSQREAALSRFADANDGALLLCTDVAARGLDIPGVDWVVQFDAPQDPAAFVHRVGRTARMGREGAALLYLAPHEASYVEFLEVRHIKVTAHDAATKAQGGGGEDGSSHGVSAGAHAEADAEADASDAHEAGREATGEGSEEEDASVSEGGEEEEEEEEEDSEDSDDDDDDARVGADELNAALRARSETNREAMEKGTRAFVSYMRGYKEHHCRFIFRHKELQLAKLASAVGLLRLPRMKEIRKAPKAATAGFAESAVDPDSVPYAEKAREKQRRAANAAAAAARAEAEARGELSGGKAAREKRKREDAAKEAERKNGEKRLTASKRRQQESREDLDDINDDYRALKKLKKGKISEEEFDFELGFEQPVGGGRDGREYAENKRARDDARRNGTFGFRDDRASRLYGAAAKAADKKPKPSKPKHLKNSKAKGGGRGAKAMKKKKFGK
jgi:ATP-dependent RNA helicase DDX55/SPB4